MPSGKDESAARLRKEAPNDDTRTAQEGVELVRLRFEQVGYTNHSGWKVALEDFAMVGEAISKRDSDLALGSGSGRPASPKTKTKFDGLCAELSSEMNALGDAL